MVYELASGYYLNALNALFEGCQEYRLKITIGSPETDYGGSGSLVDASMQTKLISGCCSHYGDAPSSMEDITIQVWLSPPWRYLVDNFRRRPNLSSLHESGNYYACRSFASESISWCWDISINSWNEPVYCIRSQVSTGWLKILMSSMIGSVSSSSSILVWFSFSFLTWKVADVCKTLGTWDGTIGTILINTTIINLNKSLLALWLKCLTDVDWHLDQTSTISGSEAS